MGNLNFAIIDSQSRFNEMLNNGEIEDTMVVFIKDTQQIWTHGLYFGNTSNNYEVLTQDEYDSKLAAGTISDNIFYYIIEE